MASSTLHLNRFISPKSTFIRVWDTAMTEVVNIIVQTSAQLYVYSIAYLSCANLTIFSGRTAISPDRQYLAVAMQSFIDVYNLPNKKLGPPIISDTGIECPVRFVHNGEAILGGGPSGQLRLWTRLTGRRLQTKQHSGKRMTTV